MGLLQSPRWRRRLVWLVVPVVLAPLAYLGVHYSNPADPFDPEGAEVADVVPPKPSPFTADEKREVRRVLKEFISTAVVRRNVPRSWDVVGPSLKEGLTRDEWRDEIPVVPYPAADRGLGQWSFVQYSYENAVLLEVFLFPQPGSGYSALTADVEVVKDDGRWLVDYWMPKKFHGPPALSAAQLKEARKASRDKSAVAKRRSAASEEEEPYQPRRASEAWLLLPVAILSLIVLVPLTLFLVLWYQNRKAMRAYERASGA